MEGYSKSTAKYIKKIQKKLNADTSISDVIEMLALDYLVAYHKKDSSYLVKVNNAIGFFMKDIPQRALRKEFVINITDYLETAKDYGTYKDKDPQTLSDELKDLSIPYYSPLDEKIGHLSAGEEEDILLSKAKIMIISDYLTKEDAEYVAEEIEKRFDSTKVPSYLHTDYAEQYSND